MNSTIFASREHLVRQILNAVIYIEAYGPKHTSSDNQQTSLS